MICYNTNVPFPDDAQKSRGIKQNGGIAQLARAIGSYPIGHGFKSNFRYQSEARMSLASKKARWSRG